MPHRRRHLSQALISAQFQPSNPKQVARRAAARYKYKITLIARVGYNKRVLGYS